MSNLTQIPRPEKLRLARVLHLRLVERLANGLPEPALDAFISQIKEIGDGLDTHVVGRDDAGATRVALFDLLDQKNDVVITWTRHIKSYLEIQGRCRRSPLAFSARAIHDAAFPDGLAFLDDHVVDQNARRRTALCVLQSPEHAATLLAVKLPEQWIASFETGIIESEAAYDALTTARGDRSAHVGMGRDIEVDWIDLMVRLRKYIASRSGRGDIPKKMEGKKLIEPLLDTLRRIRTPKKADPPAPVKADPPAPVKADPPAPVKADPPASAPPP